MDRAYSTKEIRKMLIEIAAELAKGEGMPSTHREDWEYLPPRMTLKGCGEIYRAAIRCQSNCKNWAYRLRKIADAIEGNSDV